MRGTLWQRENREGVKATKTLGIFLGIEDFRGISLHASNALNVPPDASGRETGGGVKVSHADLGPMRLWP